MSSSKIERRFTDLEQRFTVFEQRLAAVETILNEAMTSDDAETPAPADETPTSFAAGTVPANDGAGDDAPVTSAAEPLKTPGDSTGEAT